MIDTEEGRGFLQERIALFAKVILGLGALFFVVENALTLEHPDVTPLTIALHPPNAAHLASMLLSLSVWLVARRGTYSLFTLRALDVGHMLGALSLYAVMASLEVGKPEGRVDLLILLIALLMLTARAIAVPSTPRQTLWVGVLSMLPVMVPGLLYARAMPRIPGITLTFHLLVNQALWCISAITVTTLASRVIYGLRRQVAEAQQLGQYILDEKIGEGGMGAVYRARHALMRRPTAIKLLSRERAGTVSLSRFEREVQLTARLTHPNTVAIFDYGRTPDGIFYYAMEYLDGLDLERLVELDGPQPPARVAHILTQVAGALTEAHEIGLVHRDIKPGNIILCERGGLADVAKVVDFGLVKEVESADPGLSNVNTIIGTPMFMPPEALLTPDKVDARSDLYALGGVAYYLLTGTVMFEGTLMEVCGKHLHEVPQPPSARLGGVIPPDLEELVLACLEKDPAKRPASARELGDALRECDLAPWTDARAREWWRQRGDELIRSGAVRRAERSTQRKISATTLTVDINRRAS